MPVTLLKEFLDKNQIKYAVIKHSIAFTAQEIAASAHIKGDELAKTVIVKIDGKLAMCVLPASFKINFEQFKELTGAENIRLANEIEFKDKFTDCEVGAMPPFGNLYGTDVYSAESLAKRKMITFNACNHSELIQMSYADYEKLVKPKILSFSFHSKL